MIYVLILAAVLIGSLMPFQAVINAELTRFLQHPFLAALISFALGTVTLVLIVLAKGIPVEAIKRLPTAPLLLFVGGPLGALFVGSTIFFIPKLGATTMIAALITGQLLMSVFIDHYGWLGVPVSQVHAGKIVGIALLFAGLYFVMRKAT